MPLAPGDVLDGKYRVTRLIGEGGMGIVYEGEHTRIRRRVAIKTLLQTVATAETVQRFEREAQAAGRIGNEHILEVLDLGTLPTGEHYMVMEYLDGETLAQRLTAGGPMAPEDVAIIAHQILVALAAAHGAGIIHRDLKPDNVFIVSRGGMDNFVKLIDFGISKFTGPGVDAMKVTKMGALLGTPSYLSPELARGTAEADARTDIYGLGVIMYEALTGALPFESSNFNDLLFKIVFEEPKPLESIHPDLDAELSEMVMRAIAKNPADRFEDAAAFAERLGAWMEARNIAPARGSLVSPAAKQFSSSQPRLAENTSTELRPFQKTPNAEMSRPGSRSGSRPDAIVPAVSARPAPTVRSGSDSIERTWAAPPVGAPAQRSLAARFGPLALVGVALLAGAAMLASVFRSEHAAQQGTSTPASAAPPATSAPSPTPSDVAPPPTTSASDSPATTGSAAAVVASAAATTVAPSTTTATTTATTTTKQPTRGTTPSARATTTARTGPTATPTAAATGSPPPTTSAKPKGADDDIPTMR